MDANNFPLNVRLRMSYEMDGDDFTIFFHGSKRIAIVGCCECINGDFYVTVTNLHQS